MITGTFFHHWSEARARGINLFEIDPRLRNASRRFAGLENYVKTLSDEDLALMETVGRVGRTRAFSPKQAKANPRAFAVFAGQKAMFDSLMVAASRPEDSKTGFAEVVLYPAVAALLGDKDACPVIRIQMLEAPANQARAVACPGALKEICVRVEIQALKVPLSLPRQFTFRNDSAQPWARDLFKKGLCALKGCSTLSEPIKLRIETQIRRKIVAFLLFPEFTARPRVSAAALEYLFKEFQVRVRATNVRDLFDRMCISELKRLPRTRKLTRRGPA